MGTVNKAVVSVRSAITGLYDHSLKAFASGEDNVLKSYDEAIEHGSGDTTLADTLRRDRDELVAAVTKMKAVAE